MSDKQYGYTQYSLHEQKANVVTTIFIIGHVFVCDTNIKHKNNPASIQKRSRHFGFEPRVGFPEACKTEAKLSSICPFS